MRAIKYHELKRMYEVNGPEKTVKHLQEALQKGELKPEDFSIRELAEVVFSPELVRRMDPRQSVGMDLLQSGGTINVTVFSHIIGSVVQSKILEAYQQEAFVVSQLVETRLAPVNKDRESGSCYDEDYIETPQTTNRGFIVPVTKEAIFFDRMHLILQRAEEVGEVLGLNKEKRLLDLLIGVTNNYKCDGVIYNTYSRVGSGLAPDGRWVNEMTEELVDWTDVNAAEQLLVNFEDPNTNEPVLIQATTVLVTPAYRHAAHRIFNAAEIHDSPTEVTNPLGNYTVVESRLAYRRILISGYEAADAKKWWFIGDFSKAFAYMENWPITVTQSPLNIEADFNQDIVVRFKASERGTAVVTNPRYIVRSTGNGL